MDRQRVAEIARKQKGRLLHLYTWSGKVIVYATRCTAAHLKHGRVIEGDALGGRSV